MSRVTDQNPMAVGHGSVAERRRTQRKVRGQEQPTRHDSIKRNWVTTSTTNSWAKRKTPHPAPRLQLQRRITRSPECARTVLHVLAGCEREFAWWWQRCRINTRENSDRRYLEEEVRRVDQANRTVAQSGEVLQAVHGGTEIRRLAHRQQNHLERPYVGCGPIMLCTGVERDGTFYGTRSRPCGGQGVVHSCSVVCCPRAPWLGLLRDALDSFVSALKCLRGKRVMVAEGQKRGHVCTGAVGDVFGLPLRRPTCRVSFDLPTRRINRGEYEPPRTLVHSTEQRIR